MYTRERYTYHELARQELQTRLNGKNLVVVYCQKETESNVHHRLSKEIMGTVYYADTDEALHPAAWTDHLEVEFLKHRNRLPEPKSSFKLKIMGYVALVFILGSFAAIGYMFYTDPYL